MTDINWVLRVISHHPTISGAMATAHDEWVEVLLPDNRAFRFRPFAVINKDAPEEDQRELLNHLLKIGAENARPASFTHAAEPDEGDSGPTNKDRIHPQGAFFGDILNTIPDAKLRAPRQELTEDYTLLPIVRSASYFMPHHWDASDEDLLVAEPLTEFIWVGLAAETPEVVCPVRYTDIGVDPMSEAARDVTTNYIDNLRAFVAATQSNSAVEVASAELRGADVLLFMEPDNFQSSWFADLKMARLVADDVAHKHPGSTPLFIPQNRTTLVVARDTDPHLKDLFEYYFEQENTTETIYPLPHTIEGDVWQEWIPPLDHPAAKILMKLRAVRRADAYDDQQVALNEWSADTGQTQTAIPIAIPSSDDPDTVTITQWNSSFGYGSVPDADYIKFIDDAAGGNGASLWVPLVFAVEAWPEGISEWEGMYPSRWWINGFPDTDALERMRARMEQAR